MQPSPGQGRSAPYPPSGPGTMQQAIDPVMVSAPFQQLAWLSQAKGCCSGPESDPSLLMPDAFLPSAPLFLAADAVNPYSMCQSLPCKLPLPFPTQSLPSFQQQSSLAATFSKLSSQLEAQLGVPSRLPDSDEAGAEMGAERDDYLMRLLRPGPRGPVAMGAAQASGVLSEGGLACTTHATVAAQPPQPQHQAQPAAPARPPQPPAAGSPGAGQEAEGTPTEDMAWPRESPGQHNKGQQNPPSAGLDFVATLAALGACAGKVRATILRQQVVFTEQLYELHRAAAVQRLLMRNTAQPRARRSAAAPAATPAAAVPGTSLHAVPLDATAAVRAPAPAAQQQPHQAQREPSANKQAQLRAHPSPAEVASLLDSRSPPGAACSLPQPLPPHMLWTMDACGAAGPSGGFGAAPPPGDPMAWWYHTHYGPGAPTQQPLHGFGPLQGDQLAGGGSSLTPRTATAAVAAAVPLLQQQAQHQMRAASVASGGAGGTGSTRPAAAAKWWQDPQATFGPPGDPEVVARQAVQRGAACEAESAPPRSQGRSPARSGARVSGKKRKVATVTALEEASSETTGRDPGRTATTTAGGSGMECASAFQRPLALPPKRMRALPTAMETSQEQEPRPEEHAAHMLLSFSSRHL